LVKKFSDPTLNVLDVLMVVVINLANAREDAFLLLSGAKRSKPISLGSVGLTLLLKVGL